MVAALLSSATLCTTSCVDDNESASVTNIRDAKAEQLKALATLSKAQAEAALIEANASKAVKEAQAAYQQAMAEAQKLENQLQEMAVQKAQAGLEQALEAAKLKAEAALLQAKAELETAKKNLVEAMDQVDEAEKQRVQELMNKADYVLNLLQTARENKITEATTLARLKAGLVGVQEFVAQQKRTLKQQIAEQQAYLETYEKYSKENPSKDEAYKAWKKAEAEVQPLLNASNLADQEWNLAKNALAQLEEKSGRMAFIDKIQNKESWAWQYYKEVNIFDEKTEDTRWYELELKFADGTISTDRYYVYIVTYVLDAEKVEQAKANIPDEIKQYEDRIAQYTSYKEIAALGLAEVQKELTTFLAGEEYKALKKAVADAQKAYDDAKTADAKQQALNQLNNAKFALESSTRDLENAIESKENDVKAWETQIEYAQDNLANVKEREADIEEATKYLASEDAKAYTDYVNEYKAAWLNKNGKTYTAQRNAWTAYNKAATEANVLHSIYEGTIDYANLISNCKQRIAFLEKQIAGLNNVTTEEEAIKAAEEKVAQAEKEIAIYEKQYADYMAKIESLIKEEAPIWRSLKVPCFRVK